MRHGDVYVSRPDGSLTRLSPGGGAFMQAHISPDGTRAVFWGERAGAPRVWLADTATADLSPIGPRGARHPVWHPDGRIIFALEPAASETVERIFDDNSTGFPAGGTRHQLCSMRDDGSDVTALTDDTAQDQRPAVHPDGDSLAFVTNREGPPIGIAILDLTAGGMTSTGELGYRPWWSVDGTAIFHIGFTVPGRRHQIHTLRVGSGSTPIDADDAGLTHGPFADPGGDRLLVHSNRSGHWQLYELPLDGAPMRTCTPERFADVPTGHATRAIDGTMTFDAMTMD